MATKSPEEILKEDLEVSRLLHMLARISNSANAGLHYAKTKQDLKEKFTELQTLTTQALTNL
jgi:hypothetical protein